MATYQTQTTVTELRVSDSALSFPVPLAGKHYLVPVGIKLIADGSDVAAASGDDLTITLSAGGSKKWTPNADFTTAVALEMDKSVPVDINKSGVPFDSITITPAQIQSSEQAVFNLISVIELED